MSIFSASQIESSISLATLDSTQEGGERKSRESGVFIQGRPGGEGGGGANIRGRRLFQIFHQRGAIISGWSSGTAIIPRNTVSLGLQTET